MQVEMLEDIADNLPPRVTLKKQHLLFRWQLPALLCRPDPIDFDKPPENASMVEVMCTHVHDLGLPEALKHWYREQGHAAATF